MSKRKGRALIGLGWLVAVGVWIFLCIRGPLSSSTALSAVPTVICPSGCVKPGGHVRIESASNVQVGDEFIIDVRLEDITDLYGVEILLSFNPSILEVQDFKTGTVGIQVEPGNFPDPQVCFVAQNASDNTLGTIAYAVSLLNPSPPASGSGALARIHFRAIAAGTSDITITRLVIVASDSCCLDLTAEDGRATVVSPTPTPTATLAGGTVSGTVLVQGRTNSSGVTVAIGGKQATTGADGRFSITGVPAGTWTITASIANYLRAERSGVVVTNGGSVSLPEVMLLAGDINGSCGIDIFDLVVVGSAYGSSPPADARADFNQDNTINIFDLVLLAGNYNLTCPVAW